MDDDVVLQSNKIITSITDHWRQFEDFLKRIEPAAAAVDSSPNHHVRAVFSARERKGCGLRKPPEYIPVLGFDPAVMAFHYTNQWSIFYPTLTDLMLPPGGIAICMLESSVKSCFGVKLCCQLPCVH